MSIIKILNRRTDAVIFECELGAEYDGRSHGFRLGVAVILALSSGIDLRGADLSGTNLNGTYLSGTNLSDAREDYFKVLDAAPAEVPALLEAIRVGKIDGSTYSGDCACLVGTIANARGCSYENLGALVPDSSRPAERWFLAIHTGDTPANHPIAKITEEWTLEWLAKHPAPSQGEAVIAKATGQQVKS